MNLNEFEKMRRKDSDTLNRPQLLVYLFRSRTTTNLLRTMWSK